MACEMSEAFSYQRNISLIIIHNNFDQYIISCKYSKILNK